MLSWREEFQSLPPPLPSPAVRNLDSSYSFIIPQVQVRAVEWSQLMNPRSPSTIICNNSICEHFIYSTYYVYIFTLLGMKIIYEIGHDS